MLSGDREEGLTDIEYTVTKYSSNIIGAGASDNVKRKPFKANSEHIDYPVRPFNRAPLILIASFVTTTIALCQMFMFTLLEQENITKNLSLEFWLFLFAPVLSSILLIYVLWKN